MAARRAPRLYDGQVSGKFLSFAAALQSNEIHDKKLL